MFEVEVETCKEIDIASASISLNEELCEDDGTHMSDLVVGNSDSIFYHIAINEIDIA